MFAAGMFVQEDELWESNHSEGPQNAATEEALMALQARQKIQARLKMAKLFQQYRAQSIFKKHGVTVTSDPPTKKEKIRLTVHENEKAVPLTVKNSGVNTVYLNFMTSDLVENIFTIRDCGGNIVKTIKQVSLAPGEAYEITVHFYSEHAGFFEQLLVFKFETQQPSSDKFEIMRLLEVTHRASLSEEPLPESSSDTQTEDLIPGARINVLRIRSVVPLRQYPIPNSIKDLKKSDEELEKMPLNWQNYCHRFHMLLHLEELQEKTDIEEFNQEAPMYTHKSNRCVYQITVGANGQTQRLSWANVLVTAVNKEDLYSDKTYNGWVHDVDMMQVYMRISDQSTFKTFFQEGMIFRFKFSINRVPMCIMHRAIELAVKDRLKEVLFPTGQRSLHRSYPPSLTNLGQNLEQNKAVRHIVAATAKPAPYLVFGPPGTGKTVTLLEAIKQIRTTQESSNILVCAPFNSATDILCEKLLEAVTDKKMKKEVYRLYAWGFPVSRIPQSIKFHCNLNRKDTLYIPLKRQLARYKILVTSLQTAARLVTRGIPSGHYSYIFVDDAGQAKEMECIIPIAGLLNPQKCQLVLAGDPKQLGPIVTSREAKKHGLGVSLLERLMNDCDLYKSRERLGFRNRFVTKLLRNYRSHPAILKIPNELFYKAELQAHAPKECDSYCEWELLPKKGFPLIFHGVAGTDKHDADSPSLYNMAEVGVLKEYLKALLDHIHRTGVTDIEPGEIGIIAPYSKQVEKIQKALHTDKDLREKNLRNILVGTVEKFQGKEFNVILVSTVRSTLKLTVEKQRFSLGFVENEKRFNMALNRARALLIVAGDPRALETDYIWNKFIHFCFKEGGYRGITVCDAEEEEEEGDSEVVSKTEGRLHTEESDSATAGATLKETYST